MKMITPKSENYPQLKEAERIKTLNKIDRHVEKVVEGKAKLDTRIINLFDDFEYDVTFMYLRGLYIDLYEAEAEEEYERCAEILKIINILRQKLDI